MQPCQFRRHPESPSDPENPPHSTPVVATLAVATPADLDDIPAVVAELPVPSNHGADVETSSSVPVAIAHAIRGSSSCEIDQPLPPATSETKCCNWRRGDGKLVFLFVILMLFAIAVTLHEVLPDDDTPSVIPLPPSYYEYPQLELAQTTICHVQNTSDYVDQSVWPHDPNRPYSCKWQQIGHDLNGRAAGDFFGGTLRLGGSAKGSRFSVTAPLYSSSRGLTSIYDIYEYKRENGTDVKTEYLFEPVGNNVIGKYENDMLQGIMADDGYHLIMSSIDAAHDGQPHIGHFGSFQLSRQTEKWTLYGNDMYGKSSEDDFGVAAVNRNGTIVAISDIQHDSQSGVVDVYRFDKYNNTWLRLGQRLEGASKDEHWGRKVALSSDGYTIAIGSRDYNNNTGRVQVYRYNSDQFVWQGFGRYFMGIKTGENLGREVDLSADGKILAVTSDFRSSNSLDEITAENGLVSVFKYDENSRLWQQLGSDIESDVSYQSDFGYQLRTSDDGMRLAISQARYTVGSTDDDDLSAASAGRVRVYDYIEEKQEWDLIGDIEGQRNCDFVGAGFDLSPDGSRLVGEFQIAIFCIIREPLTIGLPSICRHLKSDFLMQRAGEKKDQTVQKTIKEDPDLE